MDKELEEMNLTDEESTTNIDEVEEVSEREIDEDLREKFKEETVSRMQMIHKQFTYLTKIASKRSVDYTQEDVEKMFAFLENEVASSKKEFLRKFNDDQNHFNFTW